MSAETEATPQSVEEVRKALKAQIEWYFSPTNLSHDRFLVAKMDSRGFVAIQVISQFPAVQRLSTDKALILDVLKESAFLSVDEAADTVGPRKKERTTLILRSIPSALPVEEVKAFFSLPGCPAPQSLKPEYGDTWFVTFASEAEVEKADEIVRTSATYNGKKVRCHIKNETVSINAFIGGYAPQYSGWTPQQQYGYGHYGGGGYYGQQRGYGRGGHRGMGGNRRGGRRSPDSRMGGQKAHTHTRGDKSRGNHKNKKAEVKKTITIPTENDFPPLESPARKIPEQSSLYEREKLTQIIKSMIDAGATDRPQGMKTNSMFVRQTQLNTVQIGEPFPVIYPASPSPELAAQPHSSAEVMPFLDLDFLPTLDQPNQVNQLKVATAMAQAQGIEVTEPARDNTRRRRTSDAPRPTPAASSDNADSEFKTVNHGRKKGGHGHGDRNSSSGHGGRNGGHGRERGDGGHGHGQRARANSSRNNKPSQASGPKKPTLADIIKATPKVDEKKAVAAPATDAKATAKAAEKKKSGGHGGGRPPKAATKSAEEKQAAPAKVSPAVEAKASAAAPTTTAPGKPSFAELLKAKNKPAEPATPVAAAPAAQ